MEHFDSHGRPEATQTRKQLFVGRAVPGDVLEALWSILNPRAAQNQKGKKKVVRGPPLGILFGALLAHFSALWSILTPGPPRSEKEKKTVVRWPPRGILFGALLAHVSAHRRLWAFCSTFFRGPLSMLVSETVSGDFKAPKLRLVGSGRHS